MIDHAKVGFSLPCCELCPSLGHSLLCCISPLPSHILILEQIIIMPWSHMSGSLQWYKIFYQCIDNKKWGGFHSKGCISSWECLNKIIIKWKASEIKSSMAVLALLLKSNLLLGRGKICCKTLKLQSLTKGKGFSRKHGLRKKGCFSLADNLGGWETEREEWHANKRNRLHFFWRRT